MTREIIIRREAKARGLTRYFTGKPCCNGHVAERLVSSYKCAECNRGHVRRWKLRNLEKVRSKGCDRHYKQLAALAVLKALLKEDGIEL